MSDSNDDRDESPEDEHVLGDGKGVYVPQEDGDGDDDFEIPMDFGTFLVGFFQSGMMYLGRIEHPETGEIVRNLPAAKHNIEILEMLRQKTDGNLDTEEEKMLESLLYDLRNAYVQEKKNKDE